MGMKPRSSRLFNQISRAVEGQPVQVTHFVEGPAEVVVAVSIDKIPAAPRLAAEARETSKHLARLTRNLIRYRGNVSVIAREMGVERVQVRRWCKRFNLDIESYRKPV